MSGLSEDLLDAWGLGDESSVHGVGSASSGADVLASSLGLDEIGTVGQLALGGREQDGDLLDAFGLGDEEDRSVADIEGALWQRFRRYRALRSDRLLPLGVRNHSPAWAKHAARIRWGPVATPGQADFAGLADAWDRVVVRHGDKAARAVPDPAAGPQRAVWTHPNTLTAEGLVKVAIEQLGTGGRSGREGACSIDATRRRMQGLLSVAACVQQRFQQAELQLREDLMSSSKAFKKTTPGNKSIKRK